MLEANALAVERGGRVVFSGLSFNLEAGQALVLTGANGAGKSTLLRCINRLVEPTRGEIRLRGTELTGLRGKELRLARRRIGMVFQEYNLVERLTVMENVLSGRLGYVPFWRAWLRKYPEADI
ncbi:ATP-binding cassette domain-containing protein, partial [Blautia luti]